ncbi:hypothetical protein LIER_36524 [Lithospermum erythrorhizon]
MYVDIRSYWPKAVLKEINGVEARLISEKVQPLMLEWYENGDEQSAPIRLDGGEKTNVLEEQNKIDSPVLVDVGEEKGDEDPIMVDSPIIRLDAEWGLMGMSCHQYVKRNSLLWSMRMNEASIGMKIWMASCL